MCATSFEDRSTTSFRAPGNDRSGSGPMLPFRGPPPPARGFPMPVPGTAPPAVMAAGAPPHGVMPPPRGLVGLPPPRGVALPFGGPTLGRPPPVGMMPPPGLGMGLHLHIGGLPPPGAMNPMLGLPDTGPLNVFVGKLPPDLHDNYIRHLLEKCGHVLTWKRTTDPVTGKPKGFGYCTFANPTDVLRALRLLNGFSLDSKQILLKVDSKTQARLDAYASAMSDAMRQADKERDREVELALKTLFEDRNGLMGGHQNDVASWGDLLERRNSETARANGNADAPNPVDESAAAAPTEGDQNDPENQADGAPPQGEKVRGKMILSEIEKFRLAQEQREQEMEEKRREAVRERLRREQEDEQRRKAKEEAARVASEVVLIKKEDPAKEKAANDAKEKDDRHASRKDQDRDRHKARTRERDHDRGRDRERSRERRRRDRSHSRSRERSSRHRRHRRRSRSRTLSRSKSRSRSRRRDRDRKRRRRHDSSDDERRSDTEKSSRSKRRKDSDDTRKTPEDDSAPVRAPKPMPKVVLGLKMQKTATKKEKPAPAVNVSVFAVEEEAEAKPVREIIPIDYSEEERLATASMQQRAAATTARINGRSDDLKTLVDQIPTDKDALFAFPIDWSAVEKFNIVSEKMNAWVAKKIHEYLGEEEPTMIEFIIKKLHQRASPQSILDELKLVLDDEAEMFVQLLWRRLAFEALRSASS